MALSGSRLVRLAGLAGILALAACAAERPLPTASPTFAQAGPLAGRSGRTLVTSGARYSDKGVHPATGRSGSAAATAEAVFASDGTTLLTVTPYRASDLQLAVPVGCIEKVQVRAFGADGRPLWTRNYPTLNLATGTPFTVRYAGLLPGTTLQVQANIKCIDPRRTDVVTVVATVVRQTDPAVTSLSVTSQAPLNTPTLVLAKVQELNGGQGATGTCVLSIDGEATDSIVGVWVDAGGSVDCAFAPSFGSVGTHTVRVDLTHVVPTDADPTNNSQTTTVTVADPPPPPPPGTLPPFLITAVVYDDSVQSIDLFSYSLRLVSNPAVLRDTLNTYFSRSGNDQYAGFNGIVYEHIAFPLSQVAMSQWTGTTRFDTLYAANVAPGGGSSSGAACVDLSDGPVYRIICSYEPDGLFPYGRTSVLYERSTSNAAYVSQQYFVHYEGGVPSACDPTSTDTSAPCYYVTAPLGAPLTPYGASYAFNVMVETATRRYISHIRIAQETSAPTIIDVPFRCNDVTLPSADGGLLYHACERSYLNVIRRSGQLPYLVGITEAVGP